MAESMKGLHRTCRCAEVTKDMVGSKVTLMGWVQKARNKGGLVFVDLRDRSGIMQVIFENGSIDEEGFTVPGMLLVCPSYALKRVEESPVMSSAVSFVVKAEVFAEI